MFVLDFETSQTSRKQTKQAANKAQLFLLLSCVRLGAHLGYPPTPEEEDTSHFHFDTVFDSLQPLLSLISKQAPSPPSPLSLPSSSSSSSPTTVFLIALHTENNNDKFHLFKSVQIFQATGSVVPIYTITPSNNTLRHKRKLRKERE